MGEALWPCRLCLTTGASLGRGLRLLQPQRITCRGPSGQPFAQQTLCLGVTPCPQVGLQQSIFKDFALGVAPSYPDHLVRDRFEVLHRTLVVAACKRRECLDQGRHDLAGRHLTLRQALPELGRQLRECLYITCRGIGEGAVDITKRYASPWEGAGCECCHRLT